MDFYHIVVLNTIRKTPPASPLSLRKRWIIEGLHFIVVEALLKLRGYS
jgi:hypothetical protein